MSRAKDLGIVQKSQKVFVVIRAIAKIIAVVLVMLIAYSVIAKKDPDVAKLRKIQQEQAGKAMKQELAPYQKRAAELEKESKKRILVKEETEELEWLLARTQDAKKKHTISTGAKFYPIAADAQDIWPHIGETVKIKIYPDCLSGWNNIPPGSKFTIDTPGEIEYFFWTGERILVKDNNTKWFGEVPHCSFRLRGTAGEATITVQ